MKVRGQSCSSRVDACHHEREKDDLPTQLQQCKHALEEL
jgi:hypothetical protein